MRLVLCPHCARHVRDTEKTCPFCRAVVVIAIAAASTVACGKTQRESADIYGAPPVVEESDAGTRQRTIYGAPRVVRDAGSD